VVTTADDPQGRPTVVELVPAEPRVFPVGRLDADTEGLLLLTNDGDLTHRLTHPASASRRSTSPRSRARPSRARCALREGVELDDGRHRAGQGRPGRAPAAALVIHEGRNRQVRRMCEAVGHPVVRLVRTRIGPLAVAGVDPLAGSRPVTRQFLEELAPVLGWSGLPGGGSAAVARRR
jgi:23S rRNA pseudouridine2605 synthase